MFKKSGGWADDSKQSSLTSRLSGLKLYKQDSTEDIPVIPEKQMGHEEYPDLQINKTKSESTSRVAAYRELNEGTNSKHKTFQFLEGIDLRTLTKNLLPETQIEEPDTPWNWDVLFASIVPELIQEKLDSKSKRP